MVPRVKERYNMQNQSGKVIYIFNNDNNNGKNNNNININSNNIEH